MGYTGKPRAPVASAFALLAALLVGCGDDSGDDSGDDDTTDTGEPDPEPPDFDPTAACNGGEDNCAVPFNRVSVVCTHNAYRNLDDVGSAEGANQNESMLAQLDAGVRCLMVDVHQGADGEPALCHQPFSPACSGEPETDFVEWLVELGTWLDDNPNQVVSLLVEDWVLAPDLVQAFVDADLAGSLYASREAGTEWPTLQRLIDADTRLVVFSEEKLSMADAPELIPLFRDGFDTRFDDPNRTCAFNRGQGSADGTKAFLLNHFDTTRGNGDVDATLAMNPFDVLLEHANRCVAEREFNPAGQPPTFLGVDFYEIPVEGGPLIDAVDTLEVAHALNIER